MDPREENPPASEHQQDNNNGQTNSPNSAARNGGQAQGNNDATHAQRTPDAQNQPRTAPTGNEQVLTQPPPGLRNNAQGNVQTNGQNSAPMRPSTTQYGGGTQGNMYHQYSGPYSTQAYTMPQVYQGNYYPHYGYQHPQTMHYNGGPVYPPQYYTPSVLEAHASWKDTDVAKFLTKCKTLKLNLTMRSKTS